MNLPANIAAALAEQIETLAGSLLGKPTYRVGHELRFRRKGSLAVVFRGNKRGRFYDHELGEGGDSLDLVRQVNGGSVVEAMRWSRHWLGWSDVEHGHFPAVRVRELARSPAIVPTSGTDLADRIRRAIKLWAETVPAVGSPVDAYLASRGVELPPDAEVGFHPRCPRGTERLPAMVALMRDVRTNEPRGIHRTYLRPDGLAKADGQARMMMGCSAGAAIKLKPDTEVTMGLHITEGVEDGLTLLGYEIRPVWALGSAGSIAKFPALPGIESLTVWADADKAGTDAAQTVAQRWAAAGLEVLIRKPRAAKDFNAAARSAK